MISVFSTYQVHTNLRSTYLVRILGKKYSVRTWGKKYILKQSSTRRYNTIPEYKVVRTGLYRVRTTSHDSRWCQCMYYVHTYGLPEDDSSSCQNVYIQSLIWNPVHLVYGGTRKYVLVHPSTYASGDMAVQETSKVRKKKYVPVCTDIENSEVRMYRDVPVCTVLYCHGTRWYKVVQGGTWRYKERYMEVHGGTWQYKNL